MGGFRPGWIGAGRVLEMVTLYMGGTLEKKEYKAEYLAWEILGDSEERVMVNI